MSVNGMHDKGILVFLSFVVAGVIAFMGDQKISLAKTSWFITLICGALALLLMIWFYFDASDGMGMATSFLSFGFYLAALSAIGVLASAYLFRSPGDDIKSGFDSLKNNIEQKTKNTPPNP